MSAQVFERDRPTRPQPALPAETHPYPGEPVYVPVMAARTDPAAIAHALKGVRGINFAAVDAARAVPGLTHAEAREALAVPEPLPAADPEASARERMPIGDTAEAYAVRGRRPAHAAPAPIPALSSVPGWPEGVVRGLLIAALWDATRWYGDMDGTGCGDCEVTGGLCEWHAAKYQKHWDYSDLHDFAVEAAADVTALSAVVASVRDGAADVADLAAPGSHLDLILTRALAADGGAR